MNLEDRISALEARLDQLERQAAPTRQSAELVKQSKEQAKRTGRLSRYKAKIIRNMRGWGGRPWCQKCLMSYAVEDLDLHHIRARANGGDDRPENLILLCRRCHDKEEEPARIAERKQEQMGMAGSEKLLKNRLAE